MARLVQLTADRYRLYERWNGEVRCRLCGRRLKVYEYAMRTKRAIYCLNCWYEVEEADELAERLESLERAVEELQARLEYVEKLLDRRVEEPEEELESEIRRDNEAAASLLFREVRL